MFNRALRLSIFDSLRARLLLLFLLILVPGIVFTLYFIKVEEAEQADDVRSQVLRLVTVMAEAQQRVVDRAQHMVRTLSLLVDVQPVNAERCHALLVNLIQRQSIFINLMISDVTGSIYCSAVPVSESLNVFDRTYFQQALNSSEVWMSDFLEIRATGQPTLGFAMRISNAAGQTVGVVIAGLDLAALEFNLNTLEGKDRDDVLITITDAQGTIVARSHDAKLWIGKTVVDPSVLEAIRSQQVAYVSEAVGIDGISRLYAIAPVSSSVSNNLYVTVGIPTEVAFAESRRLVIVNLGGLLLLASFGFMLIWFGSEALILRPLRTLVQTTRRISGGDLTVRISLTEGPGELRELSKSFDDMSAALEFRENEHIRVQRALQIYNRRLETLRRIDRGILGEETVDVISRAALNYVAAELSAWFANITLFDFSTNASSVLTINAESADLPFAPSPIALEMVNTEVLNSIRSGSVLYTEDVTNSPFLSPEIEALKVKGLRALLIVPLIMQGILIGSINLGSHKVRGFSAEHLQMAQELADQLAIAIQQARLRDSIKHYAAELEQRVKERTHELQESKDSVEVILNNASDAVALTDDQLIIKQVNSAFLLLFAVDQEDVFGRPLFPFVSAAFHGELDAVRAQVLADGLLRRAEMACHPLNGQEFSAELALARATLDGAANPRLVCSIHDISAHKRLETELRKTLARERELNDLKSNFTAMVSHEFRTPLAVILASSETLSSYYDKLSDEKRTRKFDEIKSQVNRMVTLLEDVLALGRMEMVDIRSTKRPSDLDNFCLQVAAEVQETTSMHHIHVSTAGPRSTVWIDEKMMHQAISNLLSNAVKYSPAGGPIELRVRYDGYNVRVEVQDHGIGIPLEDQARLFTAFNRARNVGAIGGTGLGLSIVRRAAEIHGGSIDFSSEEGIGSLFTLTLPLTLDEA